MTHQRAVRQVVLIAYGEEGAQWLRKLTVVLSDHERPCAMFKARLLQAWAVGGGQPTPEERSYVSFLDENPAPEVLRHLLDAGRQLDVTPTIDGVQLDSVLVIERWSVFGAESAMRIRLQQSFDAARRQDCEAKGPVAYDVDWLSLTDAVRGPAAPSGEVLTKARRCIAAAAVPERILLVDSVDQRSAVISRQLANYLFEEFVRTALTSELAFPRRGQPLPHLFAIAANDDEVVPFSMGILRHGAGEMTTVQTMRLKRSLRFGGRADGISAQIDERTVPDFVLADSEQLKSGRAGLRESARMRREAATGYMYRLLARPSSGPELTAELELARAYVANHFSQSASATVPASAALALMAVDAAGLAALAAATGAIAALAYRWMKREPTDVDEATERRPGIDPRLAKEWVDLCNRLEEATVRLAEWLSGTETHHTSWAAPGDRATQTIALRGDPQPNAEPQALTQQRLEAFARSICRELLDEGSGTVDEMIDSALESVAAREVAQSPRLERELLAASLDGSQREPVKRFVNQLAPFVGHHDIPPEQVIWISDPALELQELLDQLDPPGAPQRSHIGTDDPSRIVRVAFHRPTPWRAIPSLKRLFAEPEP